MSTEALDTPVLQAYRLEVREWLSAHVQPLARAADGRLPPSAGSKDSPERVARARAQQAVLFDAGFAGISFPTEYGGAGLDIAHERVYSEEAAGYDVPTDVFAVSINILGRTLLEHGTEEQRLHHLPRILRGDEIWLQLLSEPSGGSDLAGLITRATRDGDGYVLTGQKTWSTGAQHADFSMCPARTSWDVPKHQGITMFIVDLRASGVAIRPIDQIDGGREFCEEFLDDVVVPADRVVGEVNGGWAIVRGLLEIEHEWVGRSGGVGNPTIDVDDLMAMLRRRGLAADVGARRKLVEIHALDTVHRLLAARIGKGVADGTLPSGFGGLLKLGNDHVIQRRAEAILAWSGSGAIAWPPGTDDETHVTDYLRSRRLSIAGGTSEIQRNNISERALGLPREPAFDRDVPFSQVPKN
ncbi:MAG: acyl-CoA dehydrogenase family protein [Acidimicrobiia bacterium]|jgi:alkylation response protein AidB-like acyl-CoA dehydrogenase